MCEGNCENCKNQKVETDPKRRSFLSWSVGAINLAVLGGIFTPVIGFIGSPLRQKPKDDWIDVIGQDEIPVGATREVRFKAKVVDGYQTVTREYVVFLKRYPEKIVAFDPACTHLGCRILYKDDQKKYLCPCHGGVFDEDGKVVSGPPPRALTEHAVRIKDGRVFVDRRLTDAT
ncbi:MAG: ubiquinol-cytochrome c reductase iron-sulfur subunit [Armatimonadetes bacterium]|nr:ubiquinol-cytochrome c reductase iron-sulfur subunit [Armatimonadota bacterium]